jgi:DNA-binding FadR family transcriptional regulator
MATELYTLRALIEPYALHLALEADAYTPEDFERMETLARQLGELEQHGGDTYETVEADVAFHYLICSRSNHQLLLQMLKSLQSLTWLFVFNVQLHQSDYYSDEPSHYEIYEAIRSGDPARAEKVLRDHINAAGSALLACMEKGGGESTNGLR